MQINAVTDRRKKAHRIVQAFSGIASQGLFRVNRSHVEFQEQFAAYPDVAHDDLLDVVAMALPDVSETAGFMAMIEGSMQVDKLPEWRSAP